MGGFEEALDGLRMGFLPAKEAVGFLRGRREPGEIEGHAAQPLGGGCFRGGREFFGFEAGEDETVERGPGPRPLTHLGKGGSGGFDEERMDAPMGSLGDPTAEGLDLGVRKRFAFAVIGGWHAVRITGGQGDPAEEFGLGGLAGDDGGTAGFPGGEGFVAVEDGDAGGLFDAAVAGGAMGVEDGAHVAVEIDARGGERQEKDGGEKPGEDESGVHARIPFTTSEGLVTLVTR